MTLPVGLPSNTRDLFWSLGDLVAPRTQTQVGGSGAPSLVQVTGAANPPVYAVQDTFDCTQFFGGTNNGLIGPTDANLVECSQGQFVTKQLSCKISLKASSYVGGIKTFLRKQQTLVGQTPSGVLDTIQLNSHSTSNGLWYVGLASGPATAVYVGFSDIYPLNVWTCLGFSWDGTTIRLYRDGVAKNTAAFAGPLDWGAGGPWNVGGYLGAGGTFTGYARNVFVWNSVQAASWFVS